MVPRRGNGCPRLRLLIFIGKIDLERKSGVAVCGAIDVGVGPKVGHEVALASSGISGGV